jgi:hypothetical protein
MVEWNIMGAMFTIYQARHPGTAAINFVVKSKFCGCRAPTGIDDGIPRLLGHGSHKLNQSFAVAVPLPALMMEFQDCWGTAAIS